MAGKKLVTLVVQKDAPVTPGQRLNEARREYPMTQVELSQATGIPQPHISALENGNDQLGGERAERLGVALGVTAQWLLTGFGPRYRTDVCRMSEDNRLTEPVAPAGSSDPGIANDLKAAA